MTISVDPVAAPPPWPGPQSAAARIIEPRYYGGSDAALRSALVHIRDQGCRFLVAGREIADRFQTLADLQLPAGFSDLFDEIPASAFRADISSTELRSRGTADRWSGLLRTVAAQRR